MNKGGRGVRVGAWSRGPTWWGCDGGGVRYDCRIKPTRPPAAGSHLQAEPAGTAPRYAVERARFRWVWRAARRAGCRCGVRGFRQGKLAVTGGREPASRITTHESRLTPFREPAVSRAAA